MSTRPTVLYASEPTLDLADYKRVLVESGLGASRPVDDEDRLAAMLAGANLIATARLAEPGNGLVGVARCLTDHRWTCYVAELAVCASVQGLGIGQGLLAAVREQAGPEVSVVLSALPNAVGFYERIGMARLRDAFWFRRER